MTETDVVIVGAGPYGLSIAAHLRHHNVSFRIFGEPMETWLNMPRGMQLKSEGFASSLFDPEAAFPLRQYCRQNDVPYDDMGLPVSLSRFCDYGMAFQKRFVPDLDRRKVRDIKRRTAGFQLELSDGEYLGARRVVLATGITNFAYVPPAFADLRSEHLSHSSDHRDVTRFKGVDVAIVGGGSSAIDLAALMHEAGAVVRLVTRRSSLPIHTRMRLPRPFLDRLREPMTGIGPSWRSLFFTEAAPLFHRMPANRRLKWVQNQLGPAAGWFMAERIRPVRVDRGQSPTAASVRDGKVRVELVAKDGTHSKIETQHLIFATGYRPDVSRLSFLDKEVRGALTTLEGMPTLSPRFETSVPNLYVVGPAAANSFGPLMRFAVGAKFVAPRLSRHLAATIGKHATRQPSAGEAHLPQTARAQS